MIFYHRGTALEAVAEPTDNAFISRAYILEEDGEKTSLGVFGSFRDRDSAVDFAASCAKAFIDREPMPDAAKVEPCAATPLSPELDIV
jgi:hypothetical protein